MKRLITFALMATCLVISCSKFDDSAIWDKLNDHENRIAYLEEVCKKMNNDIVNLQTLVTALETNDYIVNASPLATGDGYTFIFKSGKSVVIYNGKDGKDGTDGKDGIDGKDGVTPTISVMKDVDGVYYWTVNGEWLLVNGQKVKASAIDGKNGENGTNGTNGTDGVTPKFKIEEDYWYVSYDNGNSWEKLGKATGEDGQNGSNGIDGANGEDGDTLIKHISINEGYVIFTLNDGQDTKIKLPYATDTEVVLEVVTPGTIGEILTDEQERSTLNLKVYGNIDDNDLLYIKYHMPNIESLDLSNTTLTSLKKDKLSNLARLKIIMLPSSCEVIENGAISGCYVLEQIIAPTAKISSLSDFRYLKLISVGNLALWNTSTPDLSKLIVCLNGDINGDVSTQGNGSGSKVSQVHFGDNVKTISKFSDFITEEIHFSDEINIPEFPVMSGMSTALSSSSRNTTLKKVKFGKKQKTIKRNSNDYSIFYRADSLTEIIFPIDSELEAIEGNVFGQCNSLTKLSIPGSVVKIDGCIGEKVDTLIFEESKYNLVLSGSNGGLFQKTHPSVVISHRSIPPYYSSTQTQTMRQHLSSYVEKMTLYVPEDNYNDYLRSKSDYCYWGYIGKIKLISELD